MGEIRPGLYRKLPRQKGCSLSSISVAIVIGVCLRIIFRHSNFLATTAVDDHVVDLRFLQSWSPRLGSQSVEGNEAVNILTPPTPPASLSSNSVSTSAAAQAVPAFTGSKWTAISQPQPAVAFGQQAFPQSNPNNVVGEPPVLPILAQAVQQPDVPKPEPERSAWASMNPIIRPSVALASVTPGNPTPAVASITKPAGKEKERKVAMRHLCWTCNVAVQCRSTGVNELPPLTGFPLSYKDYHFNKQNLFLHKKAKVAGGVGTLAPILPDDGASIMARYDWSDCALVGNSGSLLRSNYGARIDAHRLVVRINQAPTEGYEAHVGSKTTFRLINHMWTQRYAQLPTDLAAVPPAKRIPLEPGVALVASRLGADQQSDLEALHRRLSQQTGPSAARMLVLHRQAIPQARHLVDLYRWCRKQAGMSGAGGQLGGAAGAGAGRRGGGSVLPVLGPGGTRADSAAGGGGVTFAGGSLPTSGMVALFALINTCQKVTVYGFGEGGIAGAPYQYYKGLSGRSEGKSLHSFDAESELLDALVQHGSITRCKVAGCSSNFVST